MVADVEIRMQKFPVAAAVVISISALIFVYVNRIELLVWRDGMPHFFTVFVSLVLVVSAVAAWIVCVDDTPKFILTENGLLFQKAFEWKKLTGFLGWGEVAFFYMRYDYRKGSCRQYLVFRLKDGSSEFEMWLNGLKPDKEEICGIIAEIAEYAGFYEAAAVHVDM